MGKTETACGRNEAEAKPVGRATVAVARGGSPVYVGLAGPAHTVSPGVCHARPTSSFGFRPCFDDFIHVSPCARFMARFHVLASRLGRATVGFAHSAQVASLVKKKG